MMKATTMVICESTAVLQATGQMLDEFSNKYISIISTHTEAESKHCQQLCKLSISIAPASVHTMHQEQCALPSPPLKEAMSVVTAGIIAGRNNKSPPPPKTEAMFVAATAINQSNALCCRHHRQEECMPSSLPPAVCKDVGYNDDGHFCLHTNISTMATPSTIYLQ